MRPIVLLLLFGLIGCDSSGIDPVPFTEGLIVEVEDDLVLRLTTDGAPGCATPMAIESDATSTNLAVHVLGILVPVASCRGIIPSTWARDLPSFQGALNVSIRHNGETDRYVVRQTPSGHQLEVIRSTVTRPRLD